jgi:hypothetical protein
MLLDIGREAFRYGRVIGAIYRDTLELEVQVWLASPAADDRVAELARIYARGNDDILAWRAAIAALRAQGLEPVPQQRFILQLYGIIGYICGQIVTPNPADPAYNECARPDLRAKLPLVNVPAGRGLVLSGIGAVGGVSSSESRAREQELKKQIQLQADELLKLKNAQDEQWGPYRETLCVTDETGFGPKTKRAVRLFKAGFNQKLISAVSERLTENEKTKLDQANKRFPTCGRGGKTPPRNAFEVGLYTFGTPSDVNGVLRAALENAKTTKPDIYSPGPNDFDINKAVTALRLFYNISAPTGMETSELDDQLWIQSRKSSGI